MTRNWTPHSVGHKSFSSYVFTIVRYVHMLFSCIEQKALTRLLANSQIISDRQLVRLHNVLLMWMLGQSNSNEYKNNEKFFK